MLFFNVEIKKTMKYKDLQGAGLCYKKNETDRPPKLTEHWPLF
uniref:Uncharacterized protein n=1 Tax=Anguilla anguilla TaxID=7936 RepID=A0A0E9RPQ0_ANGAN